MDDQEQLLEELTRLRGEALNASRVPLPGMGITTDTQETAQSLGGGPYRIRPGDRITIVCAQLPQEMLQRMPYTDPSDPDFIELYSYSDLDSLLDLALTDELFRDRNAQYLQESFGDSDALCILSRVTVENGMALTPDWTVPDTVLFEWSRPS